MIAPVIKLQIQRNGFAGYDLCVSNNPDKIRLGIFALVGGKKLVDTFDVYTCYDKKADRWRFAVSEGIKLNAIEDLCYANILANGYELIDSCNQVPESDVEKAKKDLYIQRNYYGLKDPNDPNYKVKYLSLRGLIYHEWKHERDYENIINYLLYEIWGGLFNEIQPKCEEFKDAKDAAEKGYYLIKNRLDPFMEEFYKRFAEKHYDLRKVDPNSEDYDPREQIRKEQYEQKTQEDLLVRLVIDELIKSIPCK